MLRFGTDETNVWREEVTVVMEGKEYSEVLQGVIVVDEVSEGTGGVSIGWGKEVERYGIAGGDAECVI